MVRCFVLLLLDASCLRFCFSGCLLTVFCCLDLECCVVSVGAPLVQWFYVRLWADFCFCAVHC